jgi:small subunit ribosomal protein S19
MAREFLYRGMNIARLKTLSVDEFVKLLPSRQRRSYKRGLSHEAETLLKDLRADANSIPKTHARGVIILPEMVGRKIAVYNGKEFAYVTVEPEMVGHMLGEYALTRKGVKHSAAGIGATRSTKFISVK